jgi:5'-nucleotidase
MNKERRLFINQISLMAGLAALSKPMASAASISKGINTLYAKGRDVTIYHTNDLHGNLNPVIGNMGGFNQVKSLLKDQDTHGLLLDAGDFLNSSHTMAVQKQVICAMNKMGYHAAAIGDHELAHGQDHLAALIPSMRFTLVNCNYEFDSVLSKLVKQYVIINSGKYRVGITGVGHRLNNVKYDDPVKSVNIIANLLREKEKCDLVVCLSHLGYSSAENEPDNRSLAAESEQIDMIISGHGRSLVGNPVIVRNRLKQEVIISHTAWDGLMMGKTVFSFGDGRQKSNIKSNYLVPGQPYGQKFAASFSRLQSMEKQLLSA